MAHPSSCHLACQPSSPQILNSRPRQEWMADVSSRYRALAQFSKDDARIQYLRIIRSLPYGNSIFFTVKVGAAVGAWAEGGSVAWPVVCDAACLFVQAGCCHKSLPHRPRSRGGGFFHYSAARSLAPARVGGWLVSAHVA
jgi:hypothetical protein